MLEDTGGERLLSLQPNYVVLGLLLKTLMLSHMTIRCHGKIKLWFITSCLWANFYSLIHAQKCSKKNTLHCCFSWMTKNLVKKCLKKAYMTLFVF